MRRVGTAPPSSPEPGHRAKRASRFGLDVVSQTSGLALVAGVFVVFVLAAIGGLTMIGSLGTFGYIAYVVVLAVLSLALGPVFATGISLRRKGSARHQEEARVRLEAQRRKFALVSPEAERRQSKLTGAEPGQDRHT
jgi:hypothetical protein